MHDCAHQGPSARGEWTPQSKSEMSSLSLPMTTTCSSNKLVISLNTANQNSSPCFRPGFLCCSKEGNALTKQKQIPTCGLSRASLKRKLDALKENKQAGWSSGNSPCFY